MKIVKNFWWFSYFTIRLIDVMVIMESLRPS